MDDDDGDHDDDDDTTTTDSATDEDWDDDNKDGHDKRTQGVKEMKPPSLFEAPLPAVSTRH